MYWAKTQESFFFKKLSRNSDRNWMTIHHAEAMTMTMTMAMAMVGDDRVYCDHL
jgi:hypothetical protein